MLRWFVRWPEPKESRYFWFYGQTSRLMYDHRPELMLVKVVKIKNGYAYVTDGRFLYRSEGARGIWAVAEIPEEPKEQWEVVYGSDS